MKTKVSTARSLCVIVFQLPNTDVCELTLLVLGVCLFLQNKHNLGEGLLRCTCACVSGDWFICEQT